jgi:hypothetical protein
VQGRNIRQHGIVRDGGHTFFQVDVNLFYPVLGEQRLFYSFYTAVAGHAFDPNPLRFQRLGLTLSKGFKKATEHMRVSGRNLAQEGRTIKSSSRQLLIPADSGYYRQHET